MFRLFCSEDPVQKRVYDSHTPIFEGYDRYRFRSKATINKKRDRGAVVVGHHVKIVHRQNYYKELVLIYLWSLCQKQLTRVDVAAL